jgi:leucyl-tRNA synthetase
MTRCIVKVLQDQWFLNYSDPEWKEKTRMALNEMKIFPETATQWFSTVIEWLKEWACARTTGFGTPLPWGEGWIIETLSDSTIYMSFYTINKHIKQYAIKPEMLTKEVFDYIFAGNEDAEKIAAKSGINVKILEEMRKEFTYWYPVDLRVSAKELVPNHLTFFIFHHVALFPQRYWPKAIGVNGMLMIEGKQMHKSKGNFVTMKNALEEYGADATRCALLLAAEGMDDPDWRSDNVKDMRGKLEAFYSFTKGIIENAKKDEDTALEKWLMSRLQHRINEVTENLEQMKTRTALEIAFFEVWNDFRWYIRRKGNTSAKTPKNAVEIWVKLLAPFAPHMSEEVWSVLNEEKFVSVAPWPRADKKLTAPTIEGSENFVKTVIEDTQSVVRATKTTPSKIFYYACAPWKWKLHSMILKKACEEKLEISKIMKELMKEPQIRQQAKEAVSMISKIAEEVMKMPEAKRKMQLDIGIIDEYGILEDAKKFLSEEFRAEVCIANEDDSKRYDPKQRAKFAKPYRPAIFIE